MQTCWWLIWNLVREESISVSYRFFKCQSRPWLEIGPLPECWRVHNPSAFSLGFHLPIPVTLMPGDRRLGTAPHPWSPRNDSSYWSTRSSIKPVNSPLLTEHKMPPAVPLSLGAQHNSLGPRLKPSLLWGSRVLPFISLRVHLCAWSHRQKNLYIL